MEDMNKVKEVKDSVLERLSVSNNWDPHPHNYYMEAPIEKYLRAIVAENLKAPDSKPRSTALTNLTTAVNTVYKAMERQEIREQEVDRIVVEKWNDILPQHKIQPIQEKPKTWAGDVKPTDRKNEGRS